MSTFSTVTMSCAAAGAASAPDTSAAAVMAVASESRMVAVALAIRRPEPHFGTWRRPAEEGLTGRCYNEFLGAAALQHAACARRSPGVTWSRRGHRNSAGHAEAFVLVKNGQSQTYLRTTKPTLWRLNPAGPRTGQRPARAVIG